jgi:hypothetical protein
VVLLRPPDRSSDSRLLRLLIPFPILPLAPLPLVSSSCIAVGFPFATLFFHCLLTLSTVDFVS